MPLPESVTASPSVTVRSSPAAAVGASLVSVVTEKFALTPPMVTVAVVAVLNALLAMTLTATVFPLVIVVPVKSLPSTTKVPPVTSMVAAASRPLTVMALLVTVAPSSTPVFAVKLNAAGVVSAARVVTEKFALAVPMVTVAVVAVLNALLAATLTATVFPLVMVVPVKSLPSTTKVPPDTEMVAAVLRPLTVMALLVTVAPGSTPVFAVNVNASGVVSTSSMVTVTASEPVKLPSLTVNSNVSVIVVFSATFGAVNEAVCVAAPVKSTVGLPAVWLHE